MSNEQPNTTQPPANMPQPVSWLAYIADKFGVLAVVLGFIGGQSAGIIDNPVETGLIEINKSIQGVRNDSQKDKQELQGTLIMNNALQREMIMTIEQLAEKADLSADTRRLKCLTAANTLDEKKACLTRERERQK